MPFHDSLIWAGILYLSLGWGLLADVDAALADNGIDPVSEVFGIYAGLLERHLLEKDLENDGLATAFDYRGALKRDDTMVLLDRQRQKLARFDVSLIDSPETGNAFWLNAYNFFMIAHILQERPGGKPVTSVWDYGGRYNPFRSNIFARELFEVGGRRYSLDQMEKEILLGNAYREKGWAEARVHFAVNCASVGCPPLRRQIYDPENVDDLLTENTRRAFHTHRHLRVDGVTLYVSSLFDWYKADFDREEGSPMAFIRKYADRRVIERVDGTERMRFIPYDWTLNAPENFPEFR